MMRVLYQEGDPCAAKYVEGAMRASDVEVVTDLPDDQGWEEVDVVMLSDFERKRLGDEAESRIDRFVRDGGGLVMVGGWTSMGRGGYAESSLAGLLGVTLVDGDDRLNVPSGLALSPTPHPLCAALPFDPPPLITGLNEVRPKTGTEVVLEAQRVIGRDKLTLTLNPVPLPVLVLRETGPGRGAALTTDLAPHWSGGWTDWGSKRIDVGHDEELGDAYVTFLRRLIDWAAGA